MSLVATGGRYLSCLTGTEEVCYVYKYIIYGVGFSQKYTFSNFYSSYKATCKPEIKPDTRAYDDMYVTWFLLHYPEIQKQSICLLVDLVGFFA